MKEEKDKWFEVSIFGRYSYALIALEKALQIVGLYDDLGAKYIVNLLWEFPSAKNPDDWFDNYVIHITHHSFYKDHINDFTTKSNLTPYDNCKQEVINVLGESIYYDLKLFYEKAPLFIIEVIYRVIGIAIIDRYGSSGKNSDWTFEELQMIIKIMLENNIPLPSTEFFFTEELSFYDKTNFYGWGKAICRSYFNKLLEEYL